MIQFVRNKPHNPLIFNKSGGFVHSSASASKHKGKPLFACAQGLEQVICPTAALHSREFLVQKSHRVVEKTTLNQRLRVVGATGIEPVTPPV
jgi:hypothetical protein